MILTRFFILSLLISLFFIKPPMYSFFDSSLIISYLLASFVVAMIYFLIIKSDKNFANIDLFFVVGFFVVHLQFPLSLVIFDNLPELMSVYNDKYFYYVNYGTWLSSILIVGWVFGASLCRQVKNPIVFRYRIHYKKFFYFTVFLFCLFVITSGEGYLTGSIYKGGGGSHLPNQFSTYLMILSSMNIIVLSTVVFLNNDKYSYIEFLRSNIYFHLFLLVYITFYLYVGDRGGALPVLFAYLFLCGSFIKNISFKKILLIGIPIGFIMMLLAFIRADSDPSSYMQGLDGSLLFQITAELAGSARTIYASVEDIYLGGEYFFGKLWLSIVLSFVPFLQSAYLLVSNDSIIELSSHEYITSLIYGVDPSNGAGTSLVADIFLNFGSIGVVITSILLGIVFKFMHNNFLLQKNFYWILAGVVLASSVFYMSRGGLFFIRSILWSLIISAIFIKVFKLEGEK